MKTAELKTERNYGIDLLRIVAMLFVVTLHVLRHGGILDSVEPFSFKYFFVWFLEIAAFCAVNCYALITGYVGYGSKHKYSNVITLYLQTMFFALLSVILYLIFKPEVITVKSFVQVMLPFIIGDYWYFGAYFVMFFFIPIINKGIQVCEKKYLDMLIVFIVVFFSVFSLFITKAYYEVNSGYSVFWLIILYIFGAYFKKYEMEKKISNAKCIIIYFFMVVAVLLLKIVWEYLKFKQTGEFVEKGGLFIKYKSLPILLCSIALFLIFAKLNVKGFLRKTVMVLSPLTFGVYICHVSGFLWSEILNGLFSNLAKLNPILFMLAVIGAILSVYLVCSAIDYIRSKIFELFRVKKFSVWLEGLIMKIVSKCFLLFDKNNKELSE